jgi:hypothetical protein
MVLSPFLIWKEQGDKDIFYTKTAIIQEFITKEEKNRAG